MVMMGASLHDGGGRRRFACEGALAGRQWQTRSAFLLLIATVLVGCVTAQRQTEQIDWSKFLPQRVTVSPEEALAKAQADLSRYDRDRVPHQWALAQYELGNALTELGLRQADMTKLEGAVVALRAAADTWATTGAASYRANAQVRLGIALVRSRQEMGTAQLVEAVTVVRSALEEWTPERQPKEWILAQQIHALALQALGHREKGTARLEEALSVYRSIFAVVSGRMRKPPNWWIIRDGFADTLAMLGEREKGTGRLEEAVAIYRNLLAETPRKDMPREWAETQADLGMALFDLGKREGGVPRQKEAVIAYRAALEEPSFKQTPKQWALTQGLLGKSLLALAMQEGGTARLVEAVAAYRSALEILTREQGPAAWADGMSGLGQALTQLGIRENQTEWLKEAVASFRAVEEVCASEQSVGDMIKARQYLADALFALGEREAGTAQLEEAVILYEDALKFVRIVHPDEAPAIRESLERARGLLLQRGRGASLGSSM